MSDQDNGYPKSWKFGTDDPLEVEGRYVSTTTAPSGYGEVAIINLDVEGETRAVWLSTMVLKAQFADELRRRGSRDFNQGERITIARSAEKRTSEAGKPYRLPRAPATADRSTAVTLTVAGAAVQPASYPPGPSPAPSARGGGRPDCGACWWPSRTAPTTRQENAAICRTARPPCGSVSPNSTNPAAIGTALVTIVAVPAAVSASPRW